MALFVSPFAQYTDASGNPGSGYKLYFYQTGTTTPITIYSDSLFATPTANPAIADSAGQWDAIYVNTGSYKVVMKSALDVTIRTADPVSGNPVSGPTSATDNAVARFDGTTGKVIQNSGVIIDDSNNVTGVANFTLTGTLTGVIGAFSGAVSGTTGTFSGAVAGTTGTFSGVVTAAVGAVGTPSYTFTGDTNTGAYRSAADVYDISVGGIQKASFFANGFAVSLAPGLLIDPTGSTLGVSLSAVGRIVNYFTSGIGIQLGAGFASGTMVEFLRVGTAVGSITFSAGVTAYNTSSDKRKKYAWEMFDSGAILDAIEVWRFKWIVDGSVGYGVLAQDAQPAFPQAITEGEDGFLQADYSKYVPVLMAEVKDLRRRLAEAGL